MKPLYIILSLALFSACSVLKHTDKLETETTVKTAIAADVTTTEHIVSKVDTVVWTNPDTAKTIVNVSVIPDTLTPIIDNSHQTVQISKVGNIIRVKSTIKPQSAKVQVNTTADKQTIDKTKQTQKTETETKIKASETEKKGIVWPFYMWLALLAIVAIGWAIYHFIIR